MCSVAQVATNRGDCEHSRLSTFREIWSGGAWPFLLVELICLFSPFDDREPGNIQSAGWCPVLFLVLWARGTPLHRHSEEKYVKLSKVELARLS